MISDNEIRNGNFSSSKIVALTKNGRSKGSLGAPALTYIKEKNRERRLGRSINIEANARATTWGQLVENRVFGILGTEYRLVSQETMIHPQYSFWVGSPDANKFENEIPETVVDIKCPATLDSFCDLVDPLYEGVSGTEAMNVIRETHKSGEDYYWQLVSNGILTESKFAELIIYCPYLSELQDIRKLADEYDGDEQYRYRWIGGSVDKELPWIPDGGFYKNINIVRFEIPQSDKDLLTGRVVSCAGLLK